jgi:hypothetical protein
LVKYWLTDHTSLDLRELVVDAGGHTLTATQYPTITTGWWEVKLPNSVHTWVEVIYTQTFATTILDQLGPPRSGSIGLGDAPKMLEVKGAAITKDAVATGGAGCRPTNMRMTGVVGCALLLLVGGLGI